MASFWIKSLGTAAEQLRDDWQEHRPIFLQAATFAGRPGIKPGDGIVFYASGTGVIFAAGEVTSFPYKVEERPASRWPWRVDVRLDAKAEYLHNGVSLEVLDIGARSARQGTRIKRRSHVSLSEEEFEAALRALPSS